ncbi:Acg family FMN-binding oxidoreductase [Nocardia sp. BMG111209]|uniref:Acg family FMN-binding oxidoreductase n=1 Tax=Nocardia sp. BMG111209 TaxID=1160137 RepID=UPI00055EAD75|nr:hypothetical protein [Nocardia sp. BMG111209]
MTATDPVATLPIPDQPTVRTALRLAGRAPSIHNTQPWRWVFDGRRLHLYADPDRVLPAADPRGRQQLISCGAVLHHARTAFALAGWHTDTERLPDPHRPDHLADIDFRPWPDPPAGVPRRARAIGERYSDRLPMLPPPDFDATARALRGLAGPHHVESDVLPEEARARLAEISEQAAEAHRDDLFYQRELNWWTGHSDVVEGVPEAALVSAEEASRTGVARAFPAAAHSARRSELTDAARLVVLSCASEGHAEWLRTGEALSAVLLECAASGLSTCALTHLTEPGIGRRMIAAMLPHPAQPEVVIRIGIAPDDTRPIPTPRRPLDDYLEIRTMPTGTP